MAKEQVKTDPLVFSVGANLPDDEPARTEWSAAAKFALHKLDQKKHSPDSIKSWNRFYDFAQGKTGLDEWSNPKFKNDVEKVAFLFGDGIKHTAEQDVVQLALINRVRESMAGLDKKDALKDETTRMYLETLRTTFIKYTESALYKIGYKFSGVSPDIIRDLSYKKFDDVCLSENLEYDNMNGVRNAYFTAIKNATINYSKRQPVIYNEASRKGFSEDGEADVIMANADTGIDEAAEISKKIDKPYTSRNFDKIKTLIEKAMDTLPEKQRKVFNLRHFENKSYKDMAVELGTSEGSVKGSIFKARQNLTSNESLLKAAFKTILGVSPKEKVRVEETPEAKPEETIDKQDNQAVLSTSKKAIKKIIYAPDERLKKPRLKIRQHFTDSSGYFRTITEISENCGIDDVTLTFLMGNSNTVRPLLPETLEKYTIKLSSYLKTIGKDENTISEFRKDIVALNEVFLKVSKPITSKDQIRSLFEHDPEILKIFDDVSSKVNLSKKLKNLFDKIEEVKSGSFNCQSYRLRTAAKKDRKATNFAKIIFENENEDKEYLTTYKSDHELHAIKLLLMSTDLKKNKVQDSDKYKSLENRVAEVSKKPFLATHYKILLPVEDSKSYSFRVKFTNAHNEKINHNTSYKTEAERSELEKILIKSTLNPKKEKDISDSIAEKLATVKTEEFNCTSYTIKAAYKIKGRDDFCVRLQFKNDKNEYKNFCVRYKSENEFSQIKSILANSGLNEISIIKKPKTKIRQSAVMKNQDGISISDPSQAQIT